METMPYEFHVTVEARDTDTQAFLETCRELGTKGIVLDLGINNQTELTDVMTSSTKLLETDEDAMNEVDRIADGLSESGYRVIRRKIETAPWHPAAPQQSGDTMPEGSYFESHLAVLI